MSPNLKEAEKKYAIKTQVTMIIKAKNVTVVNTLVL